MRYDLELDLCGLQCPLPILRSKKALAKLAAGQVILVTATDVGALKDFPAFCKVTGHALLESWEKQDVFHFVIKKRPED
ncbi:MAG: sulfurtransferase TusA family protein [Gammaproteobacteria bacterium]|nr:sulfurtransferase TusA family protein [Gammaproteobacteria bacterium]MCF6229995.1 sulfurtransferase TusA family protein [Gammaproteobacteria bacterium]